MCGGDLSGTEVAFYNCLFSIQLISDSFLFFTEFFFLISNDVRMCIHEKVCSPACPWKSEEGAGSPGAGAEGSCELNTWDGYKELNPGPLQEHYVFLKHRAISPAILKVPFNTRKEKEIPYRLISNKS